MTPRASVLVVDDLPENLLAFSAVLEHLDVDIHCVSSGEEALRHLLNDDDVATILLDVQMPGLDGYETARRIKERERTRHIPLLFITAIGRNAERALEGYETGAVDFVSKPIDPALLRAKVEVFVELSRHRVAMADKTQELERLNADLELFSSMVSHDLQEPLRVIGGYLELLGDRLGPELDAKSANWLGRARAAAERQAAMIATLLAFARAAADGGRQQCELDAALAVALANVAASLDAAQAVVRVIGPLPRVDAGTPAMVVVLTNLVGNALKHGTDVGVEVTVSAERQGHEWVVTVADNGPGIASDEQGLVFEPFGRGRRTTAEGTGLGLALCRRMVERSGGRIWVESVPAGGTAFRFTATASD